MLTFDQPRKFSLLSMFIYGFPSAFGSATQTSQCLPRGRGNAMKKCYGEIHHGHMISASDVIDVRWHIRGVVGAFRRPRRRTERTFIMRMMVFIAIMIMMKNRTNLHHEDDGVHRNHDHDEVLERRRDDQTPDAKLERVAVLWHIAARRLGVDREVNALFL